MKKMLAMLLMMLGTSSCTTSALWDATDPNEYIAVASTRISENSLKQKGLKYYTDDSKTLFFVEKSKLQKITDYTIRTLGTPVTVALDAATTIAVVGVGVYVVTHATGINMPPETDEVRKEQEELKEALSDVRDALMRIPNHVMERTR